jgi:hypothetical protein
MVIFWYDGSVFSGTEQFWRNASVFGGTNQFWEKQISFWWNGAVFGEMEKRKSLSGRKHFLVEHIICWWNGSVFGHGSMINLKYIFKSSLLALYNCFGELLPSAKHRL